MMNTAPKPEAPGDKDGIGAILYAAGDRESYGYPIGMLVKKVNVVSQVKIKDSFPLHFSLVAFVVERSAI